MLKFLCILLIFSCFASADQCITCIQGGQNYCVSGTNSFCTSDASAAAASCTGESIDGTPDLWVTTLIDCPVFGGSCNNGNDGGCSQCTQAGALGILCGWCSGSPTVSSGCILKTDASSCSGEGAFFFEDTCMLNCGNRTNCNQCLADGTCAWWSKSSTCTPIAEADSSAWTNGNQCPTTSAAVHTIPLMFILVLASVLLTLL